ncbi:MAG: transporter substrate-binding domain-containing protein, partial [Lachnospiraceae bacterium]
MTVKAADSDVVMEKKRTVKVGITEFSNFSYKEKNGTYRGLIIDYLDHIAKYTGWQIELVEGTPDDLIDQLDVGAIDMMGCFNKTDQTTKLYDLAELSSGYSYSTLTVKKNEKQYIPGNMDSVQGIRVGIYKKATKRVAAFEQYCEANGIVYTPVYYDDPSKWEKCLDTKEADAVLTSSAKRKADEKIILNFQKEDYYFAVAKGKTEITRELNQALEQIDKVMPQLQSELYEKYFGDNQQQQLVFTEQEKNFIAENPSLRVAVINEERPISYVDTTTGKCEGIATELYSIISRETGLQFTYVPAKDYKDAVALLQNHQVDMLSGVSNSNVDNVNLEQVYSLSYLPLQTMLLQKKGTKLDENQKPKLAIPYGFPYENKFKNGTVQYYDTMAECIQAVQKGNADFTVNSVLMIENYVRKDGKDNLELISMADLDLGLSAVFLNPVNPSLISIMDKAIYAIDDAQREAIVVQETVMQNNQMGLRAFIYS